jgi:hypothetical protein
VPTDFGFSVLTAGASFQECDLQVRSLNSAVEVCDGAGDDTGTCASEAGFSDAVSTSTADECVVFAGVLKTRVQAFTGTQHDITCFETFLIIDTAECDAFVTDVNAAVEDLVNELINNGVEQTADDCDAATTTAAATTTTAAATTTTAAATTTTAAATTTTAAATTTTAAATTTTAAATTTTAAATTTTAAATTTTAAAITTTGV